MQLVWPVMVTTIGQTTERVLPTETQSSSTENPKRKTSPCHLQCLIDRWSMVSLLHLPLRWTRTLCFFSLYTHLSGLSMGQSLQVSITWPAQFKERREKWQLTHCKHNADSPSLSGPLHRLLSAESIFILQLLGDCVSSNRPVGLLRSNGCNINKAHRYYSVSHWQWNGKVKCFIPKWDTIHCLKDVMPTYTSWLLASKKSTLWFTFTILDCWERIWSVC